MMKNLIYGLIKTAGSDFHRPENSYLGKNNLSEEEFIHFYSNAKNIKWENKMEILIFLTIFNLSSVNLSTQYLSNYKNLEFNKELWVIIYLE